MNFNPIWESDVKDDAELGLPWDHSIHVKGNLVTLTYDFLLLTRRQHGKYMFMVCEVRQEDCW